MKLMVLPQRDELTIEIDSAGFFTLQQVEADSKKEHSIILFREDIPALIDSLNEAMTINREEPTDE